MYTEINTKYRIYLSNWLLIMFILISAMIVVGGLTRLTDSGLSITEWEFFKGFFPPINNDAWIAYFDAYKQIPEFKLQNYSMTLSEFKVIFWWEWAHRFFGRIIGLAFLIPLIFFSIKLGFKKLYNFYFIFILSIHLIIAFINLSLIYWNYLSLINLNIKDKKINNYIPEFFLLLIFLQIIIGAFVSGMDAGKIYNTWPLMGNSYFPDDNKFISLFKLSAFSDPSLVQYLHRNLAYLIFIIFILISYITYRNKIFYLFKAVSILGLIILLQIILGIVTILSGASILVASLHQFSSILLITSSLYFLYKNRFS